MTALRDQAALLPLALTPQLAQTNLRGGMSVSLLDLMTNAPARLHALGGPCHEI